MFSWSARLPIRPGGVAIVPPMGGPLMATDTQELSDAILRWANAGAAAALDSLGQYVREQAPYGASEGGHDGAHLVDTLETVITSEGEAWSGEIAFTADHASYVDEGTSPHVIEGNPLLAFQWEGQQVIVRSVQHPGTPRNGFFTDNVTDDRWADEIERALDATPAD